MIPTHEARQRIVSALSPVSTEVVSLAQAYGRVLAEDAVARTTQPPHDVSAMDGYAVRQADVRSLPAILTQVGEARAGGRYDLPLRPGECVRIFTGAPVPADADTIVIQEHVSIAQQTASGQGAAAPLTSVPLTAVPLTAVPLTAVPRITVLEAPKPGTHIRRAGQDFRAGKAGLAAGRTLGARDVGLAAAMNLPWLRVRRRPRVAIVSTGDELELPGDPLGPNQILASNGLALAAYVGAWGGEPVHLGILRDRPEEFARLAGELAHVDLLVTSGGASVGDYDLVRSALGEQGLQVDFWQIAMRPGKPLLFGRLGATPVLGLPGNPVSALVCALLFLRPALERLLGVPTAGQVPYVAALLGRDLPPNDAREDFLRATLTRDEAGRWIATPFPVQDSAMLSTLAQADCLVQRAPKAPAAKVGEAVQVIVL